MTPHAFITKWRASALKERSASQEHFIDLCHLLGEPTPAEADPSGETYCFERVARKDTGGDGWADVWKRYHFAWEYKGQRADLDVAFDQLRQYSLALENPPAAGEVRHLDGAGGVGPGLVGDRPVDPGDAVRARPRSRQARPARGRTYTDRDKIMLLVEPVVIRPLLVEWEAEKTVIAAELERAEAAKSSVARTKRRNEAARRLRAFLERRRRFTVLDPACGSGNFLYLALQALKDLEHRVQLEAEALGFQRAFPEVGPAELTE